MAAKEKKADENEKMEIKADMTPKTVDLPDTQIQGKNKKTGEKEKMQESLIYLGPSLPTGISENTIYRGTDETKGWLDKKMEGFPAASKLLVRIGDCQEKRKEVKTPGTLLHECYHELKAQLKNKEG